MLVPDPTATAVDPTRALWAPVTVRVAWELVLAGASTTPATVAEVREHVLRSLPLGLGANEAEELTSVGVREWLERRRTGRYRRPHVDPDAALALTASWRRRLSASLTAVGDVVLRLHYGDGFPLKTVARNAAVDPSRLESARGGVREAARIVAIEEGLSLSGWSSERLDGLIGRIARVAEPGCPGPGGLLTIQGRAHADRCPRCSRAVRLVRGGVLSPADLFPPEQAVRPTSRLRLAVILLHPDARRHGDALTDALGDLALYVAGDAWLLCADDLDRVAPALESLALAGSPARHHLRGAVVGGSARWLDGRVIGPLPLDAVEAARARPWGEIMGLDELPAPLPPPPSAARWWAAAAVAVLAAAAACLWVNEVPRVAPGAPVLAEFQTQGASLAVRFDTTDLAVVDVVTSRDGELGLAFVGVREGKGRWATGQGDYRLVLDADQALVITSATGVPDLETRLAAAQQDADPLGSLALRVRADDPDVAVVRGPDRR